MNEKLKYKLSIVPTLPGSYIMRNINNNIIYVGKAKNLKNRLTSYFTGKHDLKTSLLINEIDDFEFIITNNESEALILENQLIKSYKPKYNILLKDDKMYPYIGITKDEYPRLVLTRKPIKNKYYKVFGPYTDTSDVRRTIEILNYIYPLRKCNVLPKKSCLYFHIKQCLAPCIQNIDKKKYEQYIKDIVDFLNGKTKKIIQYLSFKMNTSSKNLEYEKALIYKNMLDSIKKIFNTDNTLNYIHETADFIGYTYDSKYLCIQIFHVRNGMVIKREGEVFIYIDNIYESIESYLLQFYTSESNVIPNTIYINDKINFNNLKLALNIKNIKTPKKGMKKRILDLVQDNAKQQLEQKKLITQNIYDRTIGAIEILGKTLKIPSPNRIEMIDNSNLSNQAIVSAVVVFINGKPSKEYYRKYKINSNVQDDYYATREVLYRRYSRMLKEKKIFPDLLIVDGGKGHLNCVKEVFKDLKINIPYIGLCKNKFHQTSAIVYKDKKINLNKNSNEYKLLVNIQEEAHRFVIDFHRKKRLSYMFATELDNIPMIGEKTKNKILQTVDLETLRKLTKSELQEIVNSKQAENIYNYFHQKENDDVGNN